MTFAIALDPDASSPMYRQLYEGVRRKILAGELVPGQRVPSSRTLAQELGVSRNTVSQSYAKLLSEGYFQTIVGSGTFVCEQIPEQMIETPLGQANSTPIKQWRSLSTYGASLADFDPFAPPDPASVISFRYGRPALNEFPFALWRQLLSRYCRLEHNTLDYTPDLLGYKALREAIAAYLARSRQVHCRPEQIIIVSGSQQAIDLVARILINRGDAIAIEEPGYLGARQAFAAQGATLRSAAVDELGLVVDQLDSRNPAKLVYATPSHQFPTGAVMSLSRRLELLGWAQANEALIIEDDYDSEYWYGEHPIPALKELDGNNTVLYMGTFSKVLFPALRVGFLVLPEDLVRVFCHAKWLSDRQSPLLEQYVLADFIQEGHLERHIRRMRNLYDRRRQTLVKALLRWFPQYVSIMGERAGMHVMIELNMPISNEEVVDRAAQAGIGITSAQPYYLEGGGQGKFVLGYAELSESQIEEGVRKLSKILLQDR